MTTTTIATLWLLVVFLNKTTGAALTTVKTWSELDGALSSGATRIEVVGEVAVASTMDLRDPLLEIREGTLSAGYGRRIAIVREEATATFSNATLRRGWVDGIQETEFLVRGGAIVVDGGVLIVVGCDFFNNFARSDDAYGYGGAIYARRGATATVTNSRFGGSKFLYNAAGTEDQFGLGGAIFVEDQVKLVLASSSFILNWADHGAGGAVGVMDSTVEISDCNFEQNLTPDNGQGLSGGYGNVEAALFPPITGNDMFGGNLYVVRSIATIFDSKFRGRYFGDTLWIGVDAWLGGAIFSAASTTYVYRTTISNFRTYEGGGVFASEGYVEVVECTIETNEANEVFLGTDIFIDDAGFGGGLYVTDGTEALVHTCTFDGNFAGGCCAKDLEARGTGVDGGDSMYIEAGATVSIAATTADSDSAFWVEPGGRRSNLRLPDGREFALTNATDETFGHAIINNPPSKKQATRGIPLKVLVPVVVACFLAVIFTRFLCARKIIWVPLVPDRRPNTFFPRRKIALLISVADYREDIGALEGPPNDRLELKRRLIEDYDFHPDGIVEVYDGTENGTKERITLELAKFVDNLTQRTFGLVYFTGHGLGVNRPDSGNNLRLDHPPFIVPRDATPDDLKEINIDELLVRKVRQSKPETFVLLVQDCCRRYDQFDNEAGTQFGVRPEELRSGTANNDNEGGPSRAPQEQEQEQEQERAREKSNGTTSGPGGGIVRYWFACVADRAAKERNLNHGRRGRNPYWQSVFTTAILEGLDHFAKSRATSNQVYLSDLMNFVNINTSHNDQYAVGSSGIAASAHDVLIKCDGSARLDDDGDNYRAEESSLTTKTDLHDQ
ncbi:hypothetical protein CTAYLR_008478 [Chrysophaeum taylorii]|uniref:Peptidase C14 caspase domain-containing protein n=1 Tax=Chrysophaeum taylorii TaxID=2483200 RepID=A0AAD7XQW8_9STRA|nr:hypothetical protein CTAYLR_008478 [Chrysophaeum taylorii]